jgi:hypothetical protein
LGIEGGWAPALAVSPQSARLSQHLRRGRTTNDDFCTHTVHFSSFDMRTLSAAGIWRKPRASGRKPSAFRNTSASAR